MSCRCDHGCNATLTGLYCLHASSRVQGHRTIPFRSTIDHVIQRSFCCQRSACLQAAAYVSRSIFTHNAVSCLSSRHPGLLVAASLSHSRQAPAEQLDSRHGAHHSYNYSSADRLGSRVIGRTPLLGRGDVSVVSQAAVILIRIAADSRRGR